MPISAANHAARRGAFYPAPGAYVFNSCRNREDRQEVRQMPRSSNAEEIAEELQSAPSTPAAPPAGEEGAETRVFVMPGAELPGAVYITVVVAFAWMLAMAWLAFSSSDGIDLDLGIATGLALMFLIVPLAIHHTATHVVHKAGMSVRTFLEGPFDTFTGKMPARQAWLEVAMIPVSLAIAATLIGIVFLLAH